MRLVSLLALSLLAVGCAPKSDTPAAGAAPVALSAATLDSVKAVDAAFAAAMNARDTTAVFAVYAADAKLLPPDSPILDAAAGRQMIAGFIAAGASDFALTPSSAYGVGDLAYVVGTASFKMGGKTEAIKYGEVLRRGVDGKWRYVMDMFSGVTPVAPPSAPAKKM